MLLIKLLNSSRNFLTLLSFTTFLCLSVIAEEKSVDIWSKKNSTKSTKENKKDNIVNEEKKIERNRNLALSVAAVSAVTVFGIILTL